MTDIFAAEGISVETPKQDIFAAEGITPPSITERNAAAVNAGVSLTSPKGADEAFIADQTLKAQSDIEILAKTRFTQEQIEAFRNNPITWTEAGKFLNAQNTLPAGGIYQGIDLFIANSAVKKLQNNEEISVTEEETLNGLIDTYVEQELRGFSIGGGIRYGLSQMPAFAVEFIASGGVGKLAQVSAQKGVEKAATALAVKAAAKATAAKAAGVAANVVARTAAMPSLYIPKYAERRLNDSMAITDKGEVIAQESQESPAKAALMAFSYSSAEVGSEMAGAALGKYVLDPVRGALKTPLVAAVNNLPASVKNAVYTAYKAINPNAKVSNVFTAAGWNGMLEELGEERLNQVLQGVIAAAGGDQQMAEGKEFTTEDFIRMVTPTPDQIAVEAGIIAIAGGVKTSSDMAFNMLKNRGVSPVEAREIVDNMSAIETENFVETLVQKPKSEFSYPETPDMPKTKQEAVIGYADGNLNETVYENTAALQDSPEMRLYDGAQKQIEKVEPPPINNEESMSDKFIREMRNELWPIHKLGEMAREQGLDVEGFKVKKFNPAEMTSRMYSSVLTQANWMINHSPFYYDKDGNAVNNGKGLKPILDDFDNYFIAKEPSSDARRKDFTDYLIGRRYLQDLVDREGVTVTEKQRLESAANMARLQEKYGEDMQFFDTFAQELYDYQKAVLYRLVVSGNMTQEKYDAIIKQNPNYIPFQRVIDKETVNRITQGNPLFDNANAKKVIKAIHGSEAEVKDPIQSIILNTHKITDLALRNDVARQVYNYKDIMPEYVQEVPPNMVNAGTAKIKVTYDKRLREKLTQAIDYFGNKFEQKKTLNERGKRGFVRGDYNPKERLVRLRLGSSDAVLAHEVGHMLDFELGLGKRMLSNQQIKEELIKLAEQRLSSDTNLKDIQGQTVFEDVRREVESADYVSYVKNDYEIIANLYDAYVNTPDLLNSIAPNAKKMFEDIVRQRPDAAFVLEIKPSLERAEETVEKEVWMPSPIPPAGTITAFVDGEKKYVLASRPIYEAMKNLSPAQLNLFERLFVLPITSIFRAGATLTPEFMIRSIPREGLTAILLNRDIKFNPRNYARGFMAVIQDAVGSKNDLYTEFARSARFSSYMELSEKTVQDVYTELYTKNGKVLQYAKNPLKILEAVGMRIDQIARVGAFDAARQAGFSDMEAALISRDVFDYSRGGKLTKGINTYVPFFRAAINGSDKLYRAFKERPVETAFWSLMTVTLPSLALTSYYLYYAPDDERQEYKEIPENLRAVFWFYKEDGEWKRIPKPFQIGQVFGTIPEMAMLWMEDENRPEGQQMAAKVMLGLFESASPVSDWSSLLPIIVKVPTEWAANYNFFFGKDIYPSFLEGKDPALRASPWTSETAKLIGETFDVSPALVENTMRGLIAGSASYVTSAGDFMINTVREWNGETVAEKPITPSDVMIIRALAQRRPSGYRSNSYQIFSERFDEVEMRHNSSKDFEGDKLQTYMDKYSKEISAYKAMNGYKKEISAIGKELRVVYESKDLTSEEKVERINQLEDQITNIAREGNKYYNSTVRN